MNDLTEALQRLVEAEPERFGSNSQGMFLVKNARDWKKNKVMGYPHMFTQDSCDEIAAAIGYVLMVSVADERDNLVVYGNAYLLAQNNRLELASTEIHKGCALFALPIAKRSIAQAALTAAINHYLSCSQ